MRLYLDMETYRPEKKDAFINERIIVVGLIEDWTPYRPESSATWNGNEIRFLYFTEWELGNEEKIVTELYSYLREVNESREKGLISFVNVVGFNILRFDIPLLVQKGVEHGMGSLAELNVLWHNTYTVDLFQTSLPFYSMKFKGLNLDLLVKWARNKGINVPEPYGSGSDVAKWYEERRYDDIIKHLEIDLRIARIVDLTYRAVYESLGGSSDAGPPW